MITYDKLTTDALGFAILSNNIEVVNYIESKHGLTDSNMIFENSDSRKILTTIEYQNEFSE